MKVSRRTKARRELRKDVFLILVGGALAVFLSRAGFIDVLIGLFGGTATASFVSGIFFTSVFTVAPASVALAGISETGSHLAVALWGGLGAMTGDLVIFYFIRDRFADNLLDSIRPSVSKHILSSFHFGFLKWLSPFLGAAIIASPLPDEMGLALMGMSKVRTAVLMPVAFTMSAVGIYLIIWFAQLV